jgi:hypothetical protein
MRAAFFMRRKHRQMYDLRWIESGGVPRLRLPYARHAVGFGYYWA